MFWVVWLSECGAAPLRGDVARGCLGVGIARYPYTIWCREGLVSLGSPLPRRSVLIAYPFLCVLLCACRVCVVVFRCHGKRFACVYRWQPPAFPGGPIWEELGECFVIAFRCRALADPREEGGDSLSSVVSVFAHGCLLAMFILFVRCRMRAREIGTGFYLAGVSFRGVGRGEGTPPSPSSCSPREVCGRGYVMIRSSVRVWLSVLGNPAV
jgi:hypothetical protein